MFLPSSERRHVMLRKWALITALGAGLVAMPLYAHGDKDEKEENHPHQTISQDQLPAAVRSALQREANGKKIENIRQETENGEKRYEAEVVSGSTGTVLEFDENGKVVERHSHNESNEKEHEGR
jgi:hypothetical protein